MDFEKKLGRLEEIVQKMEKGDLALDESLKLFEEGVSLSRECHTRLNEAEEKVKKLVGFDGAKAEIEGLEAGTVQALILQDPFKMGYEGVKALVQVLRGKGTPEKRIDTGAKVVTKENMNTPEMQKILYPLGKK